MGWISFWISAQNCVWDPTKKEQWALHVYTIANFVSLWLKWLQMIWNDSNWVCMYLKNQLKSFKFISNHLESFSRYTINMRCSLSFFVGSHKRNWSECTNELMQKSVCSCVEGCVKVTGECKSEIKVIHSKCKGWQGYELVFNRGKHVKIINNPALHCNENIG